MPILGVIAAGALITFVVVLLVAFLVYAVAGWVGLPHPIPAILAVLIVLVGVLDLLGS